MLEPFLNKVLLNLGVFIIKTLQHMFSREYCEIFKNTYFEKHLRTAAPDPRTLEGLAERSNILGVPMAY